ncbi:MAG TPA: LamG-like jellyroll fold domain-containing protein [Prolixibacteraceae bacterium]|nr:LamG-like jellyroll fold domain-containing protein [Prolixibacteraceae bacterium]
MRFSFTLKMLSLLLVFISCEEQDNPVQEQNSAPLISNQLFEIEENSPTGTLVGTIAASDPDGHALKYELLDIQGVPFEIEQGTGKILVKDQNLLDYESHPKFSFLVKATDNSLLPLHNIGVITVNVKNISEFPNQGIIARYPFNGNAKDTGPKQYDGDLVGVTPAADRKGQENSAYAFDGMSSYIKLSTKVGSGVRSISMWFNLGMNIDNRLYNPVTLLTRDGDTSNRKLFALGFIPGGWAGDPGKLRFMYSRTTEDIYYVQSNSNFWRKGIWHHVVIILDPSKGMMMYIDNVKQQAVTPFFDATDATDASDLNPLNVYVGNYSPWSYRNFNGTIDDLILFEKALSEDEINELFNE